jgi:hypothetical protein
MDEFVSEGRPARTYAQPLSGLQVSWGSVLAGAVAMLAITLILFALSLAIIMTATNVNLGSLKASGTAVFICGIVTTLIGALIGGTIAGYLPGNPRPVLGATHGFLAWGVAILVATTLEWSAISAFARTATGAAVTTAATAAQTAGSAIGNLAGGVAGSNQSIDEKGVSLLISLGYSPTEAARMVAEAQTDVQKMLRGKETRAPGGTVGTAQQVRGALDTLVDFSAGMTWIWFGTWVLAGALAIAGGAAATRRMRGGTFGSGEPYVIERPAPSRPYVGTPEPRST